jgi:hypothetical protein
MTKIEKLTAVAAHLGDDQLDGLIAQAAYLGGAPAVTCRNVIFGKAGFLRPA